MWLAVLLLSLPYRTVSNLLHEADSGCSCAPVNVPPSLCLDDMVLIQSSFHVGQTSDENIQADLKAARLARQHWDLRVAALEARLRIPSSSEMSENTISAAQKQVMSEPTAKEEDLAVVILVTISVFLALWMLKAIRGHESERMDIDPVWYHDSTLMKQTLAAAGLMVLFIGMVVFNRCIYFTGNKHLTLTDSFYLIAQIVTTVGYGDLTPVGTFGKVFLGIYSLLSISVVAGLIQEVIFLFVEEMNHLQHIKSREEDDSLAGKIKPVLYIMAAILAGMVFYAIYDPEHLDIASNFYMCVMTLCTIGFGDYHPITQPGRLFGAFWMILGAATVAKSVMTIMHGIFRHRQTLKSLKVSQEMFKALSHESEAISREDFLMFELCRHGVHKSMIELVKERFAEFDSDGDGLISLSEFTQHIDRL
jgi:voltage-gated potassium channel